jgi:hypothetical protein
VTKCDKKAKSLPLCQNKGFPPSPFLCIAFLLILSDNNPLYKYQNFYFS